MSAETAQAIEAEAKLSKEEQGKRAHAREVEKHAAAALAEKARGDSILSKYHATLVRAEASKRIAPVVSKLFNPSLAGDVADKVASRLRVAVGADGAESITIDAGDGAEPLTDASWTAFEQKHLAPYYASQGGAGAAHGTGAINQGSRLAGLRGQDLYQAALAQAKPR